MKFILASYYVYKSVRNNDLQRKGSMESRTHFIIAGAAITVTA